MDAKQIIEQVQDHLAPRLDTYEYAIYLYLLRHTRLQGIDAVTVGFKSARRRMAFGIGEKGKPMSEGTCYEKVKSLAKKSCIEIVGTERAGTRVRVRLPSEIVGLVPEKRTPTMVTLEELDFFEVEEYRLAIVAREGSKCFYCLRDLDELNYVIEHVLSRPKGDNGYRNVVASCPSCNNQKGDAPAEEFLRTLYRGGYLSPTDLEHRLDALSRLAAGELKPHIQGFEFL